MIKMRCPVCKTNMKENAITKYYECTNCNEHLKLKISFFIKLYFVTVISGAVGTTIALHVIPNYNNNLPEIIPVILTVLFAVIGLFLFCKMYTFKLKLR